MYQGCRGMSRECWGHSVSHSGQQVKAFDVQSDAPFGNHKHMAVMNFVVGVLCLGLLTASLGRMIVRLVHCRSLHRRW